MKPKIVAIKHGIKKGTIVPVKQYAGNVGKWAEKILTDNGYQIDTGKGADMPDYNLEVKTRKIESDSAHTIGTMSVNESKITSYSDSVIRQKFQQQYRIHYSDTDSVVVDEKVFDFSDPYIQSKVEEGYNMIQKVIQKGNLEKYIPGNGWLCAEITESGGSYRFRVPDAAMKKFETIASNTFNSMFSYD